MNVLIDLINYIGERKIKIIGRGENLALQLYRGIKGGKFSSDEEARAALFKDSQYQSTYYNATKRKLRDLLVNTFLATTPQKQNYRENLHLAEKKILIAKQLARLGKISSAIKIMEEVVLDCQKQDFIDQAHEAAFYLANWQIITGNHTKYKKYAALEDELLEKLQQEQRAEKYYFKLFAGLRHKKGVNAELIQMAKEYHEALEMVDLQTFNFQTFSSYISVIYFELSNQGESLIEKCHEALAYFNSLPFDLPDRTFRIFSVRMIPGLLQQGKYREAIQKLEEATHYTIKGSPNWANLMEFKAIAGFHLQDLGVVEEAIIAIRSNRKMFAIKKEEVRVLEGYLSFFAEEISSKFKLGKFLNEMPKYSADKRGMNINILIIQILILLRRRKLSPIIDRMEALRTYSYRYLKEDSSSRRPDLFIRLLQLVSRYSFEHKKVQEKATPLLAELKAEPRHLLAIDIEIVPYEVLWEEVKRVLVGFDW